MSDDKKKLKEDKQVEKKVRKHYIRPEVESEDLMVFAAVCNGTVSGGRKSNAADCNSRKINS